MHIYTSIDDEKLREVARETALTRVARQKVRQGFRLQAARRQINTAYRQISAERHSGIQLPTCADPLLENHYTIDKCATVLCDFAKSVPKSGIVLCEGKTRGLLRVYMIAVNLLENRRCSVDYSAMRTFIEAFQEISPLENSELSLLPDMMRSVCITRAAGLYIEAGHIMQDYTKALEIHERLLASVSGKRKSLLLSEAADTLSGAGITRLYTLFSENDEFAHIADFKVHLSLVGKEVFDEAAKDREKQLLMGELAVNIVNTLRFLDSLDMERMLEDFSVLGKILSEDTIYSKTDSATKAGIAASCDELARKLNMPEAAVAKAALALCTEEKHISYFLIDEDGRGELKKSLGFYSARVSSSRKLFAFIAFQLAITLAIVAICSYSGLLPALSVLLPGFMIANSVCLAMYCRIKRPSVIPRLDIKKITPDKTVVAVSALVTDEKSLVSVMERMETHYLSSKLDNTYYAVLGDFPDSKTENMTQEEDSLLKRAADLTLRLNKKYSPNEDRFFFLLRHRSYDGAGDAYMGRERKRGAIMQFFEYILSGEEKRREIRTNYALFTSELPNGLKLAAVLDSDTVMPKDALGEMIGAAMHPQNIPVVENRKIKKGYGILVPRMERLSAAETSFERIQNGFCGITPYSSRICDFYQDNFSEAIFGGKGIINIEAFFECVKGKIDDDTVLSHDMLESCFVRSGFMSDVVLYDREPKTLISWWKRQHRWIRGDWQLLPYLFASGKSKKRLNALSRWKIFDNLRRSLNAYAVLSALWIVPFYGWGAYAYFAIAAFFIDCITDTAAKLFEWAKRGRISARELVRSWEKGFFDFMCIPYAASRTFDAIVRTLYRVFISHKKMLQWQTAAQSESEKKEGFWWYCKRMWPCLFVGARFIVFPLFGFSGALILGILFLYAPFAMKQLDAELKKEKLPKHIEEMFSQLSYDIWKFFEEETNELYGFVPPDNIQLDPHMPQVFNASPTNIGMGIMAGACAHDFGFIDNETLIHRLTVTQDYIESLEKWNGHLYNWYNVKTRQKLNPAYVSTVDSGNLCACLLYAAQLLYELNDDRAKLCADRMRATAFGMDFKLLFDESKNLYYIGYDAMLCRLTEAWYDLLASEARLTYQVTCAMGMIPQKAWFSLGRVLVRSGDSRALISWGGTMFEYLMPQIFVSRVRDSLIDETCKAAVSEQIAAGNEMKPWGVSESGYYAFDRNMYYQYRAFGVKALGLSPVYAHENVIAPYATILAAMVDPVCAYENLKKLEGIGARGMYGFYEAVDYTEERVQQGHSCEIVKSFMAHHQGMSICALDNVLSDNIIKKRFERIPEIRTVLIFNNERKPDSAIMLRKYERAQVREDDVHNSAQPKVSVYKRQGRHPHGMILTNGRLSSFVTDSGVSYVKFNDVFLTRFRRDAVRPTSGLSLFIRDENGKVLGIEPIECSEQVQASMTHELHRAQTSLKTDALSVNTESIVFQGIDARCCKITVVNHSNVKKELEVGAFAEMSLARLDEDVAHPAFVKLTCDAFAEDDILFFRRRGTVKRPDIYAYAAFFGGGRSKYSTDGLNCPGRHGSCREAMESPMHESMRIEAPIEPTLCVRNEFTLEGGESRELLFVLGAAYTREQAKNDALRCKNTDFSREKSLAFAMETSALHFMGISQGKAQLFERILTGIMLDIKSKPQDMPQSSLGFEALYRFSISGKAPIVVVEIKSPTQYRLLKTTLQLLRYCAHKGEPFELVIIGRYSMSYRCDVRSYINEVVSTFRLSFGAQADEYVHVADGFDINDEEYALIMNCATVVIDPDRTLDRQFTDRPPRESMQLDYRAEHSVRSAAHSGSLYADNGIGGFDRENDEYVISLSRNEDTPLPWSNIICNPKNEGMGTLVTESGGGYTWKNNCHDMRLTPWYNDAVHDMQGELILLRDDDGNVRSIAHSRIQGEGKVIVRHGFGYSVFENPNALCDARMTVLTDTDAPQKISLVELTNDTERELHLYLDYMVDWEKGHGIRSDFSGGIAFLHSAKSEEVFYCAVKNSDGLKFSGDREGCLSFSAEKENVKTEAFTCLTGEITLRAYEKRELILIIGMAQKSAVSGNIAGATVQSIRDKLHKIKAAWEEKIGAITVKTPDADFDTLVNKRLLYQVYASRIMGRTGFYQSSGAFGYRDQLQDVLSLLYSDPERAKGQILLCASMQYEDGDVMHWWHTPGTGVRTRITDDRLFLPFVCCAYANVTGDHSVFSINTPYLRDMPIPDGCEDVYYKALHSDKAASVYEHCVKAVESAAVYGRHGLPLMGGSDWNDGMDNVGKDGGESVFLAFFLIHVINEMIPVVKRMRDGKTLNKFFEIKASLQKAVDDHAWDGAWYRRAYYGDGTPLGSRECTSCRIDLLSQVWAVFADSRRNPDKCVTALSSAKELLMDERYGIIKLLTPPFYNDSNGHDAGYIESYTEGVRENGGQYTHAAIWYLIAKCVMGDDKEITDIFRMLNPVCKGADIKQYKAEPYVIAADVYSASGAQGRGGWTWYTGSASWMYIAAIKYILGICKEGDILKIQPHNNWDEYEFSMRFCKSVYNVHVIKCDEDKILEDHVPVREIRLQDDGRMHDVKVYIAREESSLI